MVCGGYVQVGGTVRFRLRVPVEARDAVQGSKLLKLSLNNISGSNDKYNLLLLAVTTTFHGQQFFN